MIQLRFSLNNPWWEDRFESILAKAGNTLFKNKFWEFQILKVSDLVAFDLRITYRCDHAGADLWLGLLGYAVNFVLYDNRHWDYEQGRWKVYTNEQGEH